VAKQENQLSQTDHTTRCSTEIIVVRSVTNRQRDG